MALNGFKWDAQVGDRCTLAPFALILPKAVGEELAHLAESLADELRAAEQELIARPDLWPTLGTPRRVRAALASSQPWTPAAARVIRFDFHPTPDGWRISEANSDVPGGYIEASRYTQLLAETLSSAAPAGDPTAGLCDALAHAVGHHGRIGLVAAAGYLEDQQIIAHLADALGRRGIATSIASPEQITWRQGYAHVAHPCGSRAVDALFRFYQGEWMPRLTTMDWGPFFRGGLTPVCNPAAAVLTESKRLPLVWHELNTPVPTWRALLPPTCAPYAALRQPRRSWVLKGTYSNTGDAIVARRWSRTGEYAVALANAAIRPRDWVSQSRFETSSLVTPLGVARPCLGVFVVNGRACGLYGRLSLGEFVDFQAIDTPVLLEE